MKVSKWFVLSAALGVVLYPLAFSATDVVLAAPDDPPPCDGTADALRKASRLEARAKFWVRIGQILNEPDCDPDACLERAREERDEAYALADAQYQSRLEACDLLGQGPYDPQIEPEQFSADVTNPYWPLVPGRTLVFEEETDEGIERVEVTALDEVVDIDGFPCRVVHDLVTLEGDVVEDTIDWYSQHENGEAWYMGEIVLNYKNGFLDDIDGSWRKDKQGAEPGIVMLTSPVPGDVYRQEFLLNEAEDMAKVISLDETVEVWYGTFEHCIQIEEWNVLDPGTFEWKFYAPGVGFVLELKSTGERLELVDIIE